VGSIEYLLFSFFLVVVKFEKIEAMVDTKRIPKEREYRRATGRRRGEKE
jgi:hypothetical protein